VRSSMRLTDAVDYNLIKRTREIWRPRAGDSLTDDDARQIIENVTGFFSILAEWARNEGLTQANDVGSSSPRGRKASNER
jgi:hypothetical protein